MHPVQKKILKLSKTEDVLSLGLRPLGRLIGVNKPQIVKHHLQQLQRKGLLKPKTKEDIKKIFDTSSSKQPLFIKVPIVGAANCGPATISAEEQTMGELMVSQSLLRKTGHIFALVARGDSMNKAFIGGNKIEDGDYVLVDGGQRNPLLGDYILSIIDNCANIKKYSRTPDGNIALLSESTSNYPPIYISEYDDFIVNGKVIQVIKGIVNKSDK